MKYSVVIVSYNCHKFLRSCLTSIQRHSAPNMQVIVVDNNSADSIDDLAIDFPDVRFVFLEDNQGFSRACNIGATHADGEYVVFLNPDTRVTAGWLDKLAFHFDCPEVAAVGPLSNWVCGQQKYEFYTSARLERLEDIDDVASQLYERNKGQGIPTKLLIGFCLMMQKDLFTEIGGMDENLFVGYDDLDISWRLKQLERELIVASDTFIFHEGPKNVDSAIAERNDKLEREAYDAFSRKLINYYGSEDAIPSAEELWGLNFYHADGSLCWQKA